MRLILISSDYMLKQKTSGSVTLEKMLVPRKFKYIAINFESSKSGADEQAKRDLPFPSQRRLFVVTE